MPRYYKERIYTQWERIRIGNWQKDEIEKRRLQRIADYKRRFPKRNFEFMKAQHDNYHFRLQKENEKKRQKL